MFEVSLQFMEQLVELIPFGIGLYLIFDYTGALFFERR